MGPARAVGTHRAALSGRPAGAARRPAWAVRHPAGGARRPARGCFAFDITCRARKNVADCSTTRRRD
ncbi:hypothetical protein CURTO8I2_210066 [Curtobacterium sp. 8I-2]|nr:hypothetical protein CURTO8I2_210066 [Curtobacterium sp. 8I-2]